MEKEGAVITFDHPLANCLGDRDAPTDRECSCSTAPERRRDEQLLPLAERLLTAMDSKLEIHDESGRRHLNIQLKY